MNICMKRMAAWLMVHCLMCAVNRRQAGQFSQIDSAQIRREQACYSRICKTNHHYHLDWLDTWVLLLASTMNSRAVPMVHWRLKTAVVINVRPPGPDTFNYRKKGCPPCPDTGTNAQIGKQLQRAWREVSFIVVKILHADHRQLLLLLASN
jgi:hypothetical protein